MTFDPVSPEESQFTEQLETLFPQGNPMIRLKGKTYAASDANKKIGVYIDCPEATGQILLAGDEFPVDAEVEVLIQPDIADKIKPAIDASRIEKARDS